MPFSEDVTAGALVTHWRGDVDAETAHQPYESAVAVFEQQHVDSVVIDLAELTFADSTALGSMIRIQELALSHGASFALQNVPAHVRSLLTYTGLDQNMVVVESD